MIVTKTDEVPDRLAGAVAALGNFDGFHLGHQAVVGRAAALAERHGAPLAVVTFEPHPARLFKPDLPPFALTTLPQKLVLLEEFGVDLAIVLTFTRDFAARSADDFMAGTLKERLLLRGAVTGFDFTFGKDRAGTTAMLRAQGPALGLEVETVAAVAAPAADPVSSTLVRAQLAAGAPLAAAQLLGHWWRLAGTVAHGEKRGRTIGFPTANVALGDYARPKFGVYAVRVQGVGNIVLEGVANIGNRPTVAGTEARLEVHLFDFAGDIYGTAVEVELVEFIRPEQKFAGLDALKAQIAVDSASAQKILRQPAYSANRYRMQTRRAFESVMAK